MKLVSLRLYRAQSDGYRSRAVYCFDASRPLVAHPRQMPKPLPLPIMLRQRLLILANSSALSVDGVNRVSVSENGVLAAGTAPAPGT